MKVFITFSPQQQEGQLHISEYVPMGNERLKFRGTRFPILPVINGYAEAGEAIRIIVLCQDYPWCKHNLGYFRQELEALFAEKGYVSAAESGDLFDVLQVPYDDAVSSHISAFQALTDALRDGDDIHACITYGSKPAPIVMLMALRYIRQFKKDTYISCIVYGQFNRDTRISSIYDETALVHLDDMIRVLAQSNVPNPGHILKNIINL